jgi:hypothetical protein
MSNLVCIRCGRKGQRGFVTIAGKPGQKPTIVVCAAQYACAKREGQRIREEAAKGNWS